MKYLLCRPRGGLNDTLCQIELCWQYTELHNRVLIIDTEYLVATGLSIRFSRLFKKLAFNEKVIFDISAELLNKLNQLGTFPPACKGRLSDYKTKLGEHLKLIDKNTGVTLSFDFSKTYIEDLLVHDQFGGHEFGINCLARLKLTEKFRVDLQRKLSPLIGKKHIAIHVRHSDYQTDFVNAFKEIYEKSINQRLLISSDNIEVINFAFRFFDRSEVVALNFPPDTGGIGLATYATFYCDDDRRYELVVQAFSDLIGQATGTETIFCNLSPGRFSEAASKHPDFNTYSTVVRNNPKMKIGVNGFSGFSFLIASLRNNPSIITQLLTA